MLASINMEKDYFIEIGLADLGKSTPQVENCLNGLRVTNAY
jgi:hypothetical protein